MRLPTRSPGSGGRIVLVNKVLRRRVLGLGCVGGLLAWGAVVFGTASHEAKASGPLSHRIWGECGGCASEGPPDADLGGTWYWLRSPDQEKRVVAGLYNRYCIRCHGVDGRGVWDIPDVPDFTNALRNRR